MICEQRKRPHPQLIEVKATATFLNRKNEWITYFCPRCLDYLTKEEKMARYDKDFIVRRRCQECGNVLEFIFSEGRKFYFRCPSCGLEIIFTLTAEGGG